MNKRHGSGVFARCLAVIASVGALAACGGRIEPDALDPEDAATAGNSAESGDGAGAGGGSSRRLVEQCYVPTADKDHGPVCMRTDDPRLPGMFRDCSAPAEIHGDPIYDVNVTTGVVRCCYEVSDESCRW